MKNCLNCEHYDFNDYLRGFGTCEYQDKDFPAEHNCNIVENLTREV